MPPNQFAFKSMETLMNMDKNNTTLDVDSTGNHRDGDPYESV